MEKFYHNPVIAGFSPDPSVCRVGEDYYLVNSTFPYFPGVPVYHSRDLVHWEQIGNALDRLSQLELSDAAHHGGIYAPTIRYHDGLFYMITTNVSNMGNFIVTAEKPEGPWSEPYVLDTPGIDPSLLFDDDGRVWYVGQNRAEDAKFRGDNIIYIRELDLKTMRLAGETYIAWNSALRDAAHSEGPHLYKKDGMYYLMIAEGGTDFNHAVTIARSDDLTKPFVGNIKNPIVSHRTLGRDYPIVNTGHADLIETQNGQWYMFLLASRPYGGFDNLGRETFLVPVEWEDGWPVVNKGEGKVTEKCPFPDLPEHKFLPPAACDHFDAKALAPLWMHLRRPGEYSLGERTGHLRMYPGGKFAPRTPANFICRRQRHMSFTARCAAETALEPGAAAGMALMQDDVNYITLLRTDNKIQAVKCEKGEETVLAETPCAGGKIILTMRARGQALDMYAAAAGEPEQLLAKDADLRFLSTRAAAGFVGCCVGMYAVSDEPGHGGYADFDWFEYAGCDE